MPHNDTFKIGSYVQYNMGKAETRLGMNKKGKRIEVKKERRKSTSSGGSLDNINIDIIIMCFIQLTIVSLKYLISRRNQWWVVKRDGRCLGPGLRCPSVKNQS